MNFISVSKKGECLSSQINSDIDLVSSYLRDIGRVPLLTHEEEITLGRQVQGLIALETLEAELREKSGEKFGLKELALAAGLTTSQLRKKLKSFILINQVKK